MPRDSARGDDFITKTNGVSLKLSEAMYAISVDESLLAIEYPTYERVSQLCGLRN